MLWLLEDFANWLVESCSVKKEPNTGKAEDIKIPVDGSEITLRIYRPTEEQATISVQGASLCIWTSIAEVHLGYSLNARADIKSVIGWILVTLGDEPWVHHYYPLCAATAILYMPPLPPLRVLDMAFSRVYDGHLRLTAHRPLRVTLWGWYWDETTRIQRFSKTGGAEQMWHTDTVVILSSITYTWERGDREHTWHNGNPQRSSWGVPTMSATI